MSGPADNLLQRWVRAIPDWPEPGVTFRDLTPVFADAAAFVQLVTHLTEAGAGYGEVDAVLGIEARGFILGAPVAAGFVPIRKAGKLPGQTFTAAYSLEYGNATIEMHSDALQPGERVLIVDDVLATGGTMAAARELVAAAGAIVVGSVVAIELPDLGGRARLGDLPLVALTEF